MPSLPHSFDLASDIRALTNALGKASGLTVSTKYPTDPAAGHGLDKFYPHITTLLTRDGMDDAQADIALAGVAIFQHFSLFAVQQSPATSPVSEDSQAGLPQNTTTQNPTPPKSRPTQCTRIHVHRVASKESDKLEDILKSGLNAADLPRHISDLKQILLGFRGHYLPADVREERQTRSLIFVLQRSITKVSERFHTPQMFFSAQHTPWWKMMAHWECKPGDFLTRDFNLTSHVTVIFNSLSPGLLRYNTPTTLDFSIASRCVAGLAVLLDVINENLLPHSKEDWERLNTTLRMLYSLLHETEILRYIFTHSSFSAHLFSLSKSFAKENTTDNEKHDGPFFFRQLESIVAWQRGLLVLASSKVVRAAIPIDFNLIVVPSPAVGVTPIMDLVDEIYPSKGDADTRVGLIKAHLTSLGIFSDKSETNIPHHNAQLMGILMAMDDQDVLVEEVAADPRKICTMKERLLQSVSTAKECCSTCQKLAYFLDAASFPPPPCDAVVRAWSPPFGITEDMLKLLRTDLLDQFKRYLESVLREPSSEQSEHSETILDRRHEVFVKAFA